MNNKDKLFILNLKFNHNVRKQYIEIFKFLPSINQLYSLYTKLSGLDKDQSVVSRWKLSRFTHPFNGGNREEFDNNLHGNLHNQIRDQIKEELENDKRRKGKMG